MLTTVSSPVVENPASIFAAPSLADRRNSVRAHRRFPAKLVGPECPEGHGCTVTDINEHGLFVRIPATCGVSVGQRFEIVLPDTSLVPDLARVMTEGCYATIVRTARLSDPVAPQLGAGLRFDQPLLF